MGSTSGYDFSQWSGSASQRKALEEIWELSRSYQELVKASPVGKSPQSSASALAQAREYILRAETSCYLFWGDAWIPKLYEETRMARDLLRQAGTHGS